MSLRFMALLMTTIFAGPAGAVQPYVQELSSYVMLSMAGEQYQDYGIDRQSWGLFGDPQPPTPVPLSTATDAVAIDPLTGGRIAATTEAFTDLTGPLTGTMSLAATLDIAAPDPADAGQHAIFQTFMQLRYLSEDDRDANISVNYSLTSVNPELFASDTELNRWIIGWGTDVELLGGVAQNRTGVFNGYCPARTTCWLTIAAYSDLVSDFLPTGRGSFAGQFDWAITENRDVLPEPATWALLLIGFGAVGSALRSRRRAIVDEAPFEDSATIVR